MGFTNIFKGFNGQFENTRTLGAIGVLSFIAVANGLLIYQCGWLQKPFDITAYCLAFPSGLGAAVTAIGLTAGQKDNKVAQAQATSAASSTASGELPENEKIQ